MHVVFLDKESWHKQSKPTTRQLIVAKARPGRHMQCKCNDGRAKDELFGCEIETELYLGVFKSTWIKFHQVHVLLARTLTPTYWTHTQITWISCRTLLYIQPHEYAHIIKAMIDMNTDPERLSKQYNKELHHGLDMNESTESND